MSAQLILASASQSRRRILQAAGLAFEIAAPAVDETGVKAQFVANKATPAEIAFALAKLKALQVSRERPGAFVLGADQLLVCEGRFFAKAKDIAEAKGVLQSLRGRKHELVTASVLARDGAVLWRHTETPTLWMRDFSDTFLDAYLAAEGSALLACVGCYRIEGRGATLFTRVEGDNFTIQGLPLFAVLEALRALGAILP